MADLPHVDGVSHRWVSARGLELCPELLDGYERHAGDMEVELVGDSGHFIADERPELVGARARELFAPERA